MIVLVVCIIMGIIDAVVQPGYIWKSVCKIFLFLLLPWVYSRFNREIQLKYLVFVGKKGLLTAVALGLAIYVLIIGAYFIFQNVFDFSKLTKSLTETTGVDRNNFIWVALYISFVNSFLEEFFFRGLAFLKLKNYAGFRFANLFSASAFSLYHIAMMIGWFSIPVIMITLVGLLAGGIIFNFLDRKSENLYQSWLVHMFANFATNTIGFLLFAV